MKKAKKEEIIRCSSIEAWNRKKIEHPAMHRAIEGVMEAMEGCEDDDNLMLLTGPSGVGKSTIMKLIRKRILAEWAERMKVNPELLPVVVVEAFKTPERRSMWLALARRTLKACGDPIPDKKRVIEPKSDKTAMSQASDDATTDGTIMAIMNQFQRRQTVIWIIDEAHHVLYAGQGRTEKDNLETVKSICNATQTKCLLIGPYELARIVRTSDQLTRRSQEIHLAAYGNDEDEEFINAARNMIAYLPYEVSDDVTDEMLTVGTLRCVGLMKVWLRKAAYRARRRGQKLISLKLMQETRFTAKQLAVFAKEMSAGELLLRDDTKEEDEIRRYLGVPVDADQDPTPKSRMFSETGSTPGNPKSLNLSQATVAWVGTKSSMDNLPPRSLLLRPEPMGAGTGDVESLRSWIYRLAQLHCVTPIQLVWEIVPQLRRDDVAKKIEQYWNTRTPLLVKAFSEATARADLEGLTFDPWQSVLSHMGLRARHQQWCPHCLMDYPYERLLWAFQCAESCPVHGVRLLDRCPKCGSRVNVRKTSPAWHICPVYRHDHSQDQTKPSTEQQNWAARQLADLLVAGHSAARPNKDRIYGVWRYLILPHFSSVKAACTTLGISRSIADSVLYGNTRRPTITVLLALCRRLTITLDQLLLADVDALQPQVSEGARIVVRKVLPRNEVDRRVAQILRDHRSGELSISKVCSAIGIATDTLRSRFPDLSKKLAAHFHEGRREKKMQSRRLQLARAVKIIKAHGPKVTNRTIQRVGGFHNHGPWRELYAEARSRVASLKTKLSVRGEPCLEMQPYSGLQATNKRDKTN